MAKRLAFSLSNSSFLLPMSIVIVFFFGSSHAAYNVVSYGARSDGKSDSTQAFLKAWSDACNSKSTAEIYVPKGSFVITAAEFQGPCKSRILFRIDGSILAPSNYWHVGKSGYWILFRKVNRLSLYGGKIDARGAAFWACRRGGSNCPSGVRSISFSWCRKVVVTGLTSINSQTIHVAVDHCSDLWIRNMKIIAPYNSPNTDGILLHFSTRVKITGSTIMTGDDCISVGQGTKDVWMEQIACGPGHGISIGSLGDYSKEEGVQNITVTNAVFTKTQNGVRIKTWARPSTGFVRDIDFRNIIMNGVQNPIIIDQNYCPSNQGCPNQSSGVRIRGVRYRNIKGTSATSVAMRLDCSASNPCKGIKLQDIKLTYFGKTSTSKCRHAHGRSSQVIMPRSCL